MCIQTWLSEEQIDDMLTKTGPTLLTTNIAPEMWNSKKESSLSNHPFSGAMLVSESVFFYDILRYFTYVFFANLNICPFSATMKLQVWQHATAR